MLNHHINVIVTAAIGKGVYATLPTVFTANDYVHTEVTDATAPAVASMLYKTFNAILRDLGSPASDTYTYRPTALRADKIFNAVEALNAAAWSALYFDGTAASRFLEAVMYHCELQA
jgi:predicted histidine transporter YuiF (NhaC family)